ncbi:MAG: flagellar motor protein [Planctomycetota bacterium]|jgi:chemotaxis protein MotA
MELFTILGLVVAFVGVLGGMVVEGGYLSALVSPPAFMIVMVGSLGAVMVATRQAEAKFIIRAIKSVFLPPKHDFQGTVDKILELATLARREGLLALEDYTTSEDGDPFLQQCLMLAIDGSSVEAIRDTIEIDLHLKAEDHKAVAKFWQSWGTFSPTLGVLGAVLGLIHVMHNLHNPAAIGPGIAVAFVATVYGVGYANMVCIPCFLKLQRQGEYQMRMYRLILEGVIGIQSGLAPGALRSKLSVFITTPSEVDKSER